MFSDKDLQSFLDYSAEGQVLSVYLNTDPTESSTEAANLRLRNLLKAVDLPEDVQAVIDFVNLEYDWAARGLAIFSHQVEKEFQTFQFNLSVPDKVFVGEKPFIRPLMRLTGIYNGWGVVLVDKQGARLFSYNMGELKEKMGVDGEEVKQTKRGGGNAMPGRMGGSGASANIENIIDRNIKEIIDSAITFFNQQRIRRIMIGGTDDNIARFKEEMPKSWQSLVVGEFPMSMTASQQDVLEKATEQALLTRKKEIQNLVDQAFTLAAKGSVGVTGLIDTLNAIHEGRVKTLLVSENYEQTGYRCTGCGYLTIQQLEDCPFCSGTFTTIEAAVELAAQEALRNNAEVKVVRENEKLEQAGHIAAILRY